MKQYNYIKRLLISIDQLGNAICDGNPDTTISARLHWLSQEENNRGGLGYFKFLRKVVDFSFKPFDGEGHCLQAYTSQPHTVLRGSDIALGLMGIIVLASCSVIGTIAWLKTLLFGS